MSQATARHILVDDEARAQKLIDDIHSSCPSGRDGGNLGTFGRGQMVPEFDQACFDGEIGTVQGPIKTQFGYHVVQVTERS
ncbi:MAG: peptidylprolyl isomerase [Gammaproteobacteria bacterium]|nr:MAG: peptidylprolyl isomerase [Gammaproteobacteria bacterium]